jgi:hypothetical protein
MNDFEVVVDRLITKDIGYVEKLEIAGDKYIAIVRADKNGFEVAFRKLLKE